MPDPKNNGKLLAVRVNAATLMKEEWKQMDKRVIVSTQERLVGVASLIARGSVLNLQNGMGTTVLEYQDMSDITGAQISMDGATRGQRDRPHFDTKSLPIPIIHKDASYNLRVIEASRRNGTPLDTTHIGLATRKIAEKHEELLYQGSGSYTFGGGTIYGLTDHPNRNTKTITDWGLTGTGGATILTEVLEMKAQLIADGYYGPYVLDLSTEFETKFDEDSKAQSERTIRERIMAIASISEIKVADKLPTSSACLYQPTDDVVRIINAIPPQTVRWDEEGGMVLNLKIIGSQIPQVRADQSGNCGIVHATI